MNNSEMSNPEMACIFLKNLPGRCIPKVSIYISYEGKPKSE